ncbi:mobA [Symbiodinium natans]|uniref:MobA protein n=1 Tax=Symbiodinium natans TaxID=878477 RepID=A0A812JAL9_9DINO|nr:mobA [Symbiodinium natans]
MRDRIVTFTPVKCMEELPTPWPRCQELIELLGAKRKVPTKDDLILAVSHAWSHQLHPDPLGQKAKTVKELTHQAVKDYQISGEALLFFDFMSMSQNPFLPGQRERTPDEQADFLKAINALPEIFFTADAVLHIDGDWPELEVEHLHETLKEEELGKFELRENGTVVLAYNQYQADDGSLAKLPVYTVESVDGAKQVSSISDLTPKKKRFSMPKFLCPNSILPEKEDPVFVVRPSPLGKRNAVPADERGWIYFERLVSTIRVALTDEQYAARTCYSNIPELKKSILKRAEVLRHAAATSNAALKHQFEVYIEEIKTKTFAATSLDKKKASAATSVQLLIV